jgi:predicted transcriptional regulator
MIRFALTLGLVAVVVACAVPARHQVVTAPVLLPRASADLRDSVSFKTSPELQKQLDELAAAVQAMALRVASDPQLRAAAMHVASGFVATAQQIVAEQSVTIQQALKTAAQKISDAQASHQPARKP